VDYSEADLLARLLTRHGIGGVAALTDPRSVACKLPGLDQDLVLLALRLPFIYGYPMLREIREWAEGRFVPVVGMTTDTGPEALRRALDDGATEFMRLIHNSNDARKNMRPRTARKAVS
jgi:PleD family two-component response regulator